MAKKVYLESYGGWELKRIEGKLRNIKESLFNTPPTDTLISSQTPSPYSSLAWLTALILLPSYPMSDPPPSTPFLTSIPFAPNFTHQSSPSSPHSLVPTHPLTSSSSSLPTNSPQPPPTPLLPPPSFSSPSTHSQQHCSPSRKSDPPLQTPHTPDSLSSLNFFDAWRIKNNLTLTFYT